MTRIALALALPLALAAGACGYGQTPEQRALSRADSLLDDVSATPEQRVAVRAAVVDLTTTFAANKKARASTKDTMLAQLTAKTADAQVIDDAAARATSSMTNNAHAVVDAGLAIHKTLTPEQRAILTAKATPGRFMKAGFFVANRVGWGPPANAEEGKARGAARLEERLDDLKATDEQKAALRPLADSLFAEAAPLLDDRDTIVAAFTGAWKGDAPDGEGLHALIDDEAAKINDVTRAAADSFVKAHAILTPEQRAQLATDIASGGGCHGGGGGGDDDDDPATK